MSSTAPPKNLDLKSLARSAAGLQGTDRLAHYPRLLQDVADPAAELEVQWRCRAEFRANANGQDQLWLFVRADASVGLVCQRCLHAVQEPLAVERWYRFVNSEAQALEQDDLSEEDVLVFDRQFNLAQLIEDELLMALPLVPRHESCPQAVRLSAADADFVDQVPASNPFAVLMGAARSRSD